MNLVIVVEGRDDTRRLREIYPDIETIETNGSAIDEETIALIQKALQTREVIVLRTLIILGRVFATSFKSAYLV